MGKWFEKKFLKVEQIILQKKIYTYIFGGTNYFKNIYMLKKNNLKNVLLN